MERPSWPSTIIAVAVIAFGGVIFWRLADGIDIDNFAKGWASVATIVGVVTGAIPSNFFRAMAERQDLPRGRHGPVAAEGRASQRQYPDIRP